ncbi:NAD(+)/NADH kinase [Holospora curviuscula]|uniref:Inorganic polyphosphate/ATP-NAD kinase n=1 Tax=Holospora curviuscula TaxID=1082868 RepID=A0A2S5R710_9PROT|nr:NAD(+)/NADH kinase [Holospora curviuscula]PPE03121.1 inorganic polyphosphate/ATP-NAD kinase [Holospora curviuscula]
MNRHDMDAIHFLARNDLTIPLHHYIERWGQCPIERCKIIVVLGGDGWMLKSLSRYAFLEKPFYGLKFGSVGHLMNAGITRDGLQSAIENALAYTYFPFSVTALGSGSNVLSFLVFNDMCLYRQRYQALKLKIYIDETIICPLLLGDGIVCSSLLGRSAYYHSAGGKFFDLPYILGLCALNTSAATPWKGALLLAHQTLSVELLSPESRPVLLGWDGQDKALESRYTKIQISAQSTERITLLKTGAPFIK